MLWVMGLSGANSIAVLRPVVRLKITASHRKKASVNLITLSVDCMITPSFISLRFHLALLPLVVGLGVSFQKLPTQSSVLTSFLKTSCPSQNMVLLSMLDKCRSNFSHSLTPFPRSSVVSSYCLTMPKYCNLNRWGSTQMVTRLTIPMDAAMTTTALSFLSQPDFIGL